MTTTRLIKRLTPQLIGPDPNRFFAACEDCDWKTGGARFVESIEPIAADHVRQSNHSVLVSERVSEGVNGQGWFRRKP